MYRRLSISLLLVMLAFSLLAPRLVSSQDIRNWNNSTYWAWNPKGVPPAWYGAIRGLPNTEWLKGHYSDGRFVYVYDFHYPEPPQEIVLIPNETHNLRLTVIDPLGNRYVLWEGYIPNFVYLSRLTGPLMNVARDKCRPVPSPGTLLIHNPLRALFSREGVDCTSPGNTLLRGKYTFIVEAVDGNLSPTDEPRIRVLGLSYGLMGTDVEGRDVWVGFAYGAEETVLVAILGAAVMVGLALLLGMLSVLSNGVGGVADFVSKFLTATPVLPASVLLIVVFGSSRTVSWNQTYFTMNPFVLALIIGVLLMGNVSRNVRSMVEEELRKEYIESSRALGGSPLWILRKHVSKIILPYSLHQFSLAVPGIIGFITLLGFFNVSPGINWGTLMGEIILSGARYKLAWWQILPVGISLGILAFSFIGIADEIEGRFLKG